MDDNNKRSSSLVQFIEKSLLKTIKRQPINSSTEIRLTRLCTQRCRQCSVYERTTHPAMMSWENFAAIAKKLRAYGAYIGFISGGEATLVPYLDKILIEAKNTFSSATTLVSGLYNKSEIVQKFGTIALQNDIHVQTSLDGLGELGDNLRGAKDFSATVLKHMKWLARNRGNSKSLLYANIVINNLNLEQVPELISRIKNLGWKATIGVYHSLTATTRTDDELKLRPDKRLERLVTFLDGNPDILNLRSFVKGISDFVSGKPPGICAFVDAPALTTRTTIMENGDVHLCYGEPIGNLIEQNLQEIFTGKRYHQRIAQYKTCRGCWTTCYTQRYLLIHPRSMKEFIQNLGSIRKLKRKSTTEPKAIITTHHNDTAR